MPGNPLIPLGTLNRVKGSIVWTNNSTLNVTAPFLSRLGIRIAFEGQLSEYYQMMAGVVPSPEPYQMVMVTAALVKTQPLAQAYKQQVELNSFMGDGAVYPDLAPGNPGIGTYPISNCSIVNVRELSMAGDDPAFVVTFRGAYYTNSAMWS